MQECCREVLGSSVVGKCVCVWGSVVQFSEQCREGVLWRSVVVKCF